MLYLPPEHVIHVVADEQSAQNGIALQTQTPFYKISPFKILRQIKKF